MQKISLTIRVDAEDLARWQEAAKKLGESTSAWMRRILNGGSNGRSDRGESTKVAGTAVAAGDGEPRGRKDNLGLPKTQGRGADAEESKGLHVCISCEGELSAVKGKLVCMDESCGMRGIEQKGKR